jgi:hypothetical protein
VDNGVGSCSPVIVGVDVVAIDTAATRVMLRVVGPLCSVGAPENGGGTSSGLTLGSESIAGRSVSVSAIGESLVSAGR